MPHDEKQNADYRYAETEFMLYVLRVCSRRRNTTIHPLHLHLFSPVCLDVSVTSSC